MVNMIRSLLIVTLLGLALGAPSTKIDGKLQEHVNGAGTANIVVSFEDTEAVVAQVNSLKFANRGAKITALKAHLQEHTARTQKNAVNALNTRAVPFKSLWISNRIYITGADEKIIQHLASLKEVLSIREEVVLEIPKIIPSGNNSILAEWGVEKIEAPAAWALPGGNNGQGVVVSSIDTGVLYTHEALKNNYRQSYGWYDPYQETELPRDQYGHGTHTMGTIVGSGGIGVAPGAQWISCKGCATFCSESALTACGEFLLCPHSPTGDNPDCTQAPHLVSNSWGGGQGATWYDPVIDAWRAANIIPIFSQGNGGTEGCESASSPGDNVNVIGVGSTTSTDDLSTFSARGPTVAGAIKPDIVAPGTSVRSSWNAGDSEYYTLSGTSMACPHVAGTVALLLSKNPNLTYDQVKSLLGDHANRELGPTYDCGGTPTDVWPNNIYGYGRINARASLASAIDG